MLMITNSPMVRSITRAVIDALFPRYCIICESEGVDLCSNCMESCSWPKPKPHRHQWITAIWNYRDPRVKTIVVTLKNTPNHRLALACAEWFVCQLKNTPQSPHLWILVPIPISRKRYRQRGFNQSELIARAYRQALMNHHGLTLTLRTDILMKQKSTQKQGTSSSREERMSNMDHVFAVTDKSLVAGKCIIVIDDVTTTGATLHDARRALQEAGATKVLAWTIAN